jgi:hypothetical protein
MAAPLEVPTTRRLRIGLYHQVSASDAEDVPPVCPATASTMTDHESVVTADPGR